MKYNVLILGSGGREHALAHRLQQDESTKHIHVIPGNDGMKEDHITIYDLNPTNFALILSYVRTHKIDFIVVGPENLLEAGVVDYFRKYEVPIVGPNKVAALLETSKAYAKRFMQKYDIPTAKCHIYDHHEMALEGLANFEEGKVVVKASALAGGKGVILPDDMPEARQAIYDFMCNPNCKVKSKEVVLEERLEGHELSVFALYDGDHYQIIGHAKDYKRLRDGDEGPNTGGMGTFSFPGQLSKTLETKIKKEVFDRVLAGMQAEGTPFTGVLFVGLMIKDEDFNVIEFNVRFGDPETQSILPRIDGDFTELLFTSTQKKLNQREVRFNDLCSVHVVQCSSNYPSIDGAPMDLGHPINGSKALGSTKVYYAGVKDIEGVLYNNGGRVLGITSLGGTLDDARIDCYQELKNIQFKNNFYRKDIALGKQG